MLPEIPESETPIWRYLLIIVAFGCILYMANLGKWDLWPSDEPRFGQIEREMLRSGDWLVPHVNGRTYTDKPPLFFWTGGIMALLNGGHVNAWTTRLPSALSGIGALIFTFFIGLWLFNGRAALLGTLATGITEQFIDQARTAQTDMIMTVFAIGALAAFTACWFGRLKVVRAAILFGICSGLAVLGKGPVGIIVPVGSIVLFILLAREWKRVRWPLVLIGLFFFSAVVLAWLLPMRANISQGASNDLLWDQSVTRYLSATGHLQPPWFFLQQLPTTFLPVTLLLPFAAIALWREKRAEKRLSREHLFLLCWFVFVLFFFSCSSGKRDQYILPLFPALGLLAGDWLDRVSRKGPLAHSAYTVIIRIVGSLYILVAIIAAVFGARILSSIALRIEGGTIPTDWFSFPLISCGLALAGVVLWAGTWRKGWIGGFAGLAAGTAIFWLTIFLFIYPPLNNRRSARPLCEALNREWKPGETVYSYEFYRSEYQLFGDYLFTVVEDDGGPKSGPGSKQAQEAKMIAEFRGPKRAYCLMRGGKDFTSFKSKLGSSPYYTLWDKSIGHRDVVVVSNQP